MKTAQEHAAKAVANTFLRKVQRGETIDSKMALTIHRSITGLLGLLELSRVCLGDDVPIDLFVKFCELEKDKSRLDWMLNATDKDLSKLDKWTRDEIDRISSSNDKVKS